MDSVENSEEFPIYKEISELFWSDLNKAPFKECINCKTELLEGNVPYMIEKAVKGFNGTSIKVTVFEYAVCVPCATRM